MDLLDASVHDDLHAGIAGNGGRFLADYALLEPEGLCPRGGRGTGYFRACLGLAEDNHDIDCRS